jgi:arabinan endo-1,5-alpha-L-arabinosidase
LFVLRIVVDRLNKAQRAAAGGDTESYTAYTSQDGITWVRGGTWTHSLGEDAQIALTAFGLQDPTADYTAEFDYVRVYTLP